MLFTQNLHFNTGGTTRIAIGTPGGDTANVLTVIVDSANVIHMNPTRTVFNTPVNVGQSMAVTGNLFSRGYAIGQTLREDILLPRLAFGGNSTGIIYSTLLAAAVIEPHSVSLACRFILTSKGTATGNVNIVLSGLPKCNADDGSAVAWCGFYAGMAANTAPLMGRVFTSGTDTVINLHMATLGNVAVLTEVNCSNTTDLMYSAWYNR